MRSLFEAAARQMRRWLLSLSRFGSAAQRVAYVAYENEWRETAEAAFYTHTQMTLSKW